MLSSVRSRHAALAVGASGLLLAPGPVSGTFDGLPWSTPTEILGIAVLALALAVPPWRRSMLQAVDRNPRIVIGLAGFASVLTVLKVIAAVASPGAGAFAGCYLGSPDLSDKPGCEVSFENPWGVAGATRFDRSIDFAPRTPTEPFYLASTWNLGFVNDLQFNVMASTPDALDLRRFPFRATWSGEAEVSSTGRVAVAYVGEGVLSLDQSEVVLTPNYGEPLLIEMEAPPGRHELRLDFSFDSAMQFGENPPGPYATLQVTGLQAASAPWWMIAVTWLVDLAALAMIAATAWGGRTVWRRADQTLVLPLGGLAAVALTETLAQVGVVPASVRGQLSATAIVGIGVVMAVLVLRPARTLGVGIPIAVLVAAFETLRRVNHVSEVTFRSRGDDWLTYQAFARSMLEGNPLRGGEDVFYYQPGFRYVLYALRWLFGDGDALVAMVQVAGFVVVAVALGAAGVAGVQVLKGRVLVGVVIGATLAFGSTEWFLEKALDGLSEVPAWIGLLGIGVMLVRQSASTPLVAISAVAACVALIRPNQLPAMVVLVVFLCAGALRQDRQSMQRQVVSSGAVFVGLLLLPLAHNVAYGGAWELLPTGANTVEDLALRDVPSAFTDAEVRATLVDKAKGLLHVGGRGFPAGSSVLSPFLLMQAAWVIAAVTVVARRRKSSQHGWRTAFWLLWPFTFAASHIAYDIWIYYPRHVVAFNLALVIGAVGMIKASQQSTT